MNQLERLKSCDHFYLKRNPNERVPFFAIKPIQSTAHVIYIFGISSKYS